MTAARPSLGPSFGRDRRASTALEFALIFPTLLLLLLGVMMIYTLIASRRAVDYGIERALRTAAVNSAGGASALKSVYASAAGAVWTSAGVSNGVTVQVSAGGTGTLATANTFSPGDTVQVTVTFNWVASGALAAPYAARIFNPATLTATGSVRVIN